jgi:hypothetical protein
MRDLCRRALPRRRAGTRAWLCSDHTGYDDGKSVVLEVRIMRWFGTLPLFDSVQGRLSWDQLFRSLDVNYFAQRFGCTISALRGTGDGNFV